MADVIDADAKGKPTEDQPERRDECECVFFNETDKTIVVNQVEFDWDGPQPLLSSKREVAAGEALRCDNRFYCHARHTASTRWLLDMEMDGHRYSNDPLEVKLWEKDGGKTVWSRLHKMRLYVDPPVSDGGSAPMKKR